MSDAANTRAGETDAAYKTLFENLNTGVYRNTGGPQGRFIKANPAIAVMFGYDSVEEFMQVAVADLYANPEDRNAFVREIQQRGFARNRLLQLKRKDGAIIWGVCSATVKYDDKGNILWIDGIIEDVTERKEAQDQLSLQEEELRTLFENLNAGVYRNTGGPQGRFIKANPAIAVMFGYDSVEEFMQVAVADLYANPEDRNAFVREIQQRGFARNRELQLKKKDGTPIWGSCTATAKFDERGNLHWIDGIIEDITVRKEAQLALARTNEVLNNILSASPVGIGLVENSHIQWANEELAHMFGFDHDQDYVGKDLAVLYPSEEAYKTVFDSMESLLKEGLPAQADAIYRCKDGHTFEGHFKMSCPDPLNPSKRAIFTIHDISWRRKAEAEQLQREKMQAVLETAGAVCHELNQPLQSISGFADLMVITCLEGKSPDSYVSNIKKQVEKLGQITHKLMNLTKYETKPYLMGKIVDIDKSSK